MLSERRSAKWIMPAGDRGVGQLVDQDEAAERAVGAGSFDGIGLEHDLAVGRELGDADRIEAQRLRREMLERVDVDLIFGCLDRRGDSLRAELHPVAAAGEQLLVRHPHDRRFELVGGFGRIGRSGNHVAARAVDLVL